MRGAARHFGLLLGGGAALLVAAAAGRALADGAAGRGVLADLAPAVDGVARAGAELARLAPSGALRGGLVLALLAALALAVRRAGGRGGALQLLAALGLGFGAQSYLCDERILLGGALYALAVAAFSLGRREPRPLDAPLPPLAEALGVLALFALYAAVALVRLDVFPDLYFDEVAYLRAARMHLGQVEPGPILVVDGQSVYTLAQFRAQTVPFLLHLLAVRPGTPALLTLRVASAAAGAATLVVAWLAVRARVGARVALWMLALCAGAPLLLLYARSGLYIELSLLHAALCFAAILWVERRWDRPSAALLGALLGASLYFYQLSWFVPLFAAAAVAATPSLWRRPGAAGVGTTVAACALLVVLPGLAGLREGLEAVNAQTFDRAVWNRPVKEQEHAALVVAGRGADEGLEAYAQSVGGPELEAALASGTGDRRVVVLRGAPERVQAAIDAAGERGWRALRDPFASNDASTRLARIVGQLFYAPSPESAGRWVDAPLWNPLLAPLVVFGLVEAARRRRTPALRLLLVWVVLGSVVPAVVGGVFPRRVLLALPFLGALAALPLLELCGALARGRRFAGPLAALASAALFAAVFATDAHRYFARFDQRFAVPSHEYGILELLKVVRGLPPEESVLLPQIYRRYQLQLARDELFRPGPLLEREDAVSRERVRAISCGETTPFDWVALDVPEHRRLFARLGEDFLLREEGAGAFRLWRVVVRKQDGCRPPRRARSGRRGPGILAP